MIVWGIRCRRCQGNLALEHDKYGPYVSCLQCGHIETGLTVLTMTNPNGQGASKVTEKKLTTMRIAPRSPVGVG